MVALSHLILGVSMMIAVSYSHISLNKCCPKGQIIDSLKLKCGPPNNTKDRYRNDFKGELDWVPHVLRTAQGNVTHIEQSMVNKDYEEFKLCATAQRHLKASFYWGPPLKPSETRLPEFEIFVNNGTLLEITMTGIRVAFFPSTSYCVDRLRGDPYNSHVALVCLCTEKTCFQKCCPHGKYLDASKNTCIRNPSLNINYLPSIYDDNLLPLAKMPEHMYAVPKFPQCKNHGYRIINPLDRAIPLSFYMLSDGYAVLFDNSNLTLLPPDHYCIDLILLDIQIMGPNLAVCKERYEANSKNEKPLHARSLPEDVNVTSSTTCPQASLAMSRLVVGGWLGYVVVFDHIFA